MEIYLSQESIDLFTNIINNTPVSLDFRITDGTNTYLIDLPRLFPTGNMPGWSGLETLTRLRVHQKTRSIPVLMVTAEQTGADIEEAFKRGAKGFVIKPVELMRLIKKVEEHILPDPSPPPAG